MKKFNKLVAVSSAALILAGAFAPSVSAFKQSGVSADEAKALEDKHTSLFIAGKAKNDFKSVSEGLATSVLTYNEKQEVKAATKAYNPTYTVGGNISVVPETYPTPEQAVARAKQYVADNNIQDVGENDYGSKETEGEPAQYDVKTKKATFQRPNKADAEAAARKHAADNGLEVVSVETTDATYTVTWTDIEPASDASKPAPKPEEDLAKAKEAVVKKVNESKLPEADKKALVKEVEAAKDAKELAAATKKVDDTIKAANPGSESGKPGSESEKPAPKPEHDIDAEVLAKKLAAARKFAAANGLEIKVNNKGEILFVNGENKQFVPVFDKKYEFVIGQEPKKANQHDELAEIDPLRRAESGLKDYYPTKEQALRQAAQLNAENPDKNHYVVEMGDGQFYVAVEPKLLTVRDVERQAEESIKYQSQAAATKAGDRLKGIYKNLGYEIKPNDDGTYSLKLMEEIQKPAEKNTKFFNSVHDAERHAEKQVGKDQYYVVQKTVDGRYIVRYYPKTGIRPYEQKQIDEKRFNSYNEANSFAKAMSRRYLNSSYEVEVDPVTGQYKVVFKAAAETGGPLKGENAEQKAGEKSPAATDTSGAKKDAGSAKAQLPETGEAKGFAAFGAAALALLAGLGLVAPRFKKED